jgi:hypothetical protein
MRTPTETSEADKALARHALERVCAHPGPKAAEGAYSHDLLDTSTDAIQGTLGCGAITALCQLVFWDGAKHPVEEPATHSRKAVLVSGSKMRRISSNWTCSFAPRLKQ